MQREWWICSIMQKRYNAIHHLFAFLLTYQICIRGSVRKLLGWSTMAACTESWGLNKNESGCCVNASWTAEALRPHLEGEPFNGPFLSVFSTCVKQCLWVHHRHQPPQPQRHRPSSNRNDDFGRRANTQPSGHSKQCTNWREELWRDWNVMEREERK